MTKSGKNSAKASSKPKKPQKLTASRDKTREYVQNLLELHKLQGVLLDKLAADI